MNSRPTSKKTVLYCRAFDSRRKRFRSGKFGAPLLVPRGDEFGSASARTNSWYGCSSSIVVATFVWTRIQQD